MTRIELPRLLIVDDEAAQVTALVRTLQREGYAPTGAHSPAEALNRIERGLFDIVITDLQMPQMNGVDLLRAAHEIDPDLVGIVMTGHGTIDTAIEAMKNGALDYVLKPFNLSIILPVLSRALAMRRLRLENAALVRRLAERNTELEAANRELEAFTASVSHDLRTPLHAMIGFSDLLLRESPGPLTTEQREYLSDIRDSGRRLTQLTEDLLRLARLGRQPLAKASVDVSALVESVLTDIGLRECGRPVDLRVGALPDATADPSLLRQVFVNLLSNALKFSRDRTPAVIEVTGSRAPGYCTYAVRDNGVGFDMEKAAKLFGVFQRMPGSEGFDGTGVGLSIAQRIVERHGGRISAESRPGEGACFAFTLAD